MLHITTTSHLYSCRPKDKYELQDIIIERIKNEGNECDLNDIDVSDITDMSCLFNVNPDWNSGNKIFKDFNGNVSLWDVSNVTNMCGIFNWCFNFNCDLSDWDVSNVENMHLMFNYCENFNRNLDGWNVSKVKDMGYMFQACKKLNYDISDWDVSNVENMRSMFKLCVEFNGDKLETWNVSKVKDMKYAFLECPTKPTWYNYINNTWMTV